MVHRPADSRLLSNLLQHEKDYVKSLTTTLERSQASIASFSAFASASPPPTSHAINSIVAALVGAEEGLRRYAGAVDDWCEMLRALKEMEEDVANVMRDREILVDRLIKASKSTKAKRSSFLSSPNPSHTQLSLSSDHGHSPLSNPKLTLAQSELQACEAHLAEKERELEEVRMNAIHRGLLGRCQALMDCGRTWDEMGKEGVKALQALHSHGVSGLPNGHGHRLHLNGGLTTGSASPHRPSSDISSSVSPSQSASQNGHAGVPQPSGLPGPSSGLPNGQPSQSYRLTIPPAHAIPEQLLPPSIAERRITEEPDDEMGGSSADEAEQEQNLVIHENKPFASAKEKGKEKETPPTRKKSQRKKASTVIVGGSNGKAPVVEKRRPDSVQFPTSSSAPPGFSLNGGVSNWTSRSDDNLHGHTTRDRKKSSFLHSITGLFKSSPTMPSYQPSAAHKDDSPSRWKSGWTTRTDKNIKRVKDDDSSDEGVRVTRTGVVDAPIDYEGLKRKSTIEAKALPEPGGHPSGGGGKRLRKPSRKGGPAHGRKGSGDSAEKGGGEGAVLTGANVGGDVSRKLSGRRASKEMPVLKPQTSTSVYNANDTVASPESSVTVVRSSSRAMSLDGARPILKRPNDKRRSIDVTSDPGYTYSPNSTPPPSRSTFANGAKSTPPSANSSRFSTRGTPGQQSLMSIVENVSAQNRANWGKVNPSSMLLEVKAPQPVASGGTPLFSVQDYSADIGTARTPSPPGGRIGRPRSPTMAATQALSANRLSTITGSASAPSLPLRSGASDGSSVYSHTSGTPARPLRSALRTRTPSPNPAATRGIGTTAAGTAVNSPGQNAQSQIYSPRIPGMSASDAMMMMDMGSGVKTTKARSSTGTFGQPISGLPSPSVQSFGRGHGKERASDGSSEVTVQSPPATQLTQPTSPVESTASSMNATATPRPRAGLGYADDLERRWSINSFASGDEDFQDALESIPPTPPPRDDDDDEPFQLTPQQHTVNLNRDSSPARSEHSQSTEQGVQPAVSGQPAPVADDPSDAGSPPVRRKSVRVALPPTFSDTPPAMEDYEEEGEKGTGASKDYWNAGPSQKSHGWSSRADQSNAALHDIWEDSSDEDEGYSLAKQLLQKGRR